MDVIADARFIESSRIKSMNILNSKDPDAVSLIGAEARNVWPGAAEARQGGLRRRIREEEFYGKPVLLVYTIVNVRVELVFTETREGRARVASTGLRCGD